MCKLLTATISFFGIYKRNFRARCISRVCGWGRLLHYQPKFNVGLFSCTQHMPATRKSSFIGVKEGFLWGYM